MLMPMLAEMTGNIHIAAAAAGAAIGVGLIGGRASEAVGRNPGAATPILVQSILSTAFAEGIVFFAIFLAKSLCPLRGRSGPPPLPLSLLARSFLPLMFLPIFLAAEGGIVET